MARTALTTALLAAFLALGPRSVLPQATDDAKTQAEAHKAAADVFAKKGDIDSAIREYQSAVALWPDYFLAHNELGALYFKKKDFANGAKCFREAVRIKPDYALGYYNLAYTSRKAGQYFDAVSAYKRYIRSKPNDADAHFGLAESLRAIGVKKDALTEYEKYLSIEKRPSEAKWIEKAKAEIAALRAEMGGGAAPDPAAPTIQSPAQEKAASAPALSQPPVNPSAAAVKHPPPLVAPKAIGPGLVVKGQMLSSKEYSSQIAKAMIAEGDQHFLGKNYALALQSYRDASLKDSESAEAFFKLGVTYAVMGQYPPAIEKWREVLRIIPDHPGAQENIKRAEAKIKGNGGEQAKDGQQAAKAQQVAQALPASPAPPTNHVEYYKRAMRMLDQGRLDEALSDLKTAISLKHDYAPAYVGRGDVLRAKGKCVEAVEEYRKALVFDPAIAAPYFGLGECYKIAGDRAEALKFFRQYTNSTARDVNPSLKEKARKFINGGS